jgi:manganese/iron transport system substrate-binding protein
MLGRKMAAMAVGLAVGLAACGSGGSTTSPGATAPVHKVQVVTTTTQLADFAKIVGGDDVDVYSIAKPNVDPHDYEPTAADITAAAHADLIIKNGVGLEKWFDSAVNLEGSHATVVDASEGVQLRQAEGSTAKDPHIWTSVVNAKIMVGNISEALQEADVDDKDNFIVSERAYDAQLDSLEREINSALSVLPNKKIVTDHESLGYYCDEFGLDYVGSVIPSFDSQADVSSADIARLVNDIKQQGVKAVFTEKSLPAKASQTVATEAGVKVVTGDSAIYGDSLGPAGSDGETYIGMMRHNTNVLVDNLR